MEPNLDSSEKDQIASLVQDMNSIGYGCILNYICHDDLISLQKLVLDKVNSAAGEYIAFEGVGKLQGTLLEDIGKSDRFINICKTIYAAGTGSPAPEVPFYQVLRCLSGQSGQKHAYLFHYDSYILTALLPIIMPTEGKTGDLIMFPNTRNFRNSYVLNLFEKILLDNALSQYVLRKLTLSHSRFSKKVKMTPGNLYFFWGSRSIHANEPCDPDKIRATALFHYVDPHTENSIRRWLRPNSIRT